MFKKGASAMGAKFELKEVKYSDTEKNYNEYELLFSDGTRDKTVVLTGDGKLKEALKI